MSHSEREILHIIVAHESVIVKSGLITTLRQLKSVHVHPIEVSSLKDIAHCIAMQPIDALFISPDFECLFNFSEFKKRHPNIPVIAVLSRLYASNTVCDFAGHISIFDSVDQIEYLLSTLSELALITENTSTRYHSKDSNAPTVSIPKYSKEKKENESLSEREKEIIISIVEGLSNKEIAEKLYLSIHTVITHRRNITKKLQIHSTSGLTIYAIVNGLVQIEEQ